MNPAWMPDAQFGMKIEDARAGEDGLLVQTTGAELRLDAQGRVWSFHQRIPARREVLRLHWNHPQAVSLQLGQRTSGSVFARSEKPRLDFRANGDSLFAIWAHEPVSLRIERQFEPCFADSDNNHHLLLDEYGGFGVYCSRKDLADHFKAYEKEVAAYDLPADTVLWIAVCPPKPYDWQRSMRDHVIWHHSGISTTATAYPDDATLVEWSKHGNLVLLQSELLLWKDWNLGFEPRLGDQEFARVRDTIHRLNMRFMVYTSPYYFLKGTALESHAMNSFEGFTNWPPGTPTGENMELFLSEIERMLRRNKPDGLYFDGQYIENAAALYALARRSRALLGPDGIMEWHSTAALGSGLCYLPQADAYCDYILRGEGRDLLFNDPLYMRFFVSCYNSSNSIGVLCNNGPPATQAVVDAVLNTNCRMHTLAGWLTKPAVAELIEHGYRNRLGPAYQAQFEQGTGDRQTRFSGEFADRGDEYRRLGRTISVQPAPLFAERFDRLEGWRVLVSASNPGPPGLEDAKLRIRSHANYYSYLRLDWTKPMGGFSVRARLGTDGGAAWGPGVLVRWPNHVYLRLGIRNDNLVQADIYGEQRIGGQIRPDAWIRLRVRWERHVGVIEYAVDGGEYQRLWTFEHAERLCQPPSELMVGKVPYNGRPEDFSIAGPLGECELDDLELYPPASR